jgi:lipopolysaccharide export system protein LptA
MEQKSEIAALNRPPLLTEWRLSLFFIFFLATLTSNQSLALLDLKKTNDDVEITADEFVEWSKADSLYEAKGKAIAKQADSEVQADSLKILYRMEKNNRIMSRMDATGNVILVSKEAKASGDLLVYHLETGIAVLTGTQLKLTSPEYVITARDSFTFFDNENKAHIKGLAKATYHESTIESDEMLAWFHTLKTNEAQQSLKEAEAHGHVKITTPNDIAYGDKAYYNGQSEKAILTGNVRITRAKSDILGSKAEIDLKTGISKMLSSTETTSGTQGRVRGVIRVD